MGVWLLIAAATAAECDPATLVERTEQAVLEARWDDAWDLLDDTEAAFGCSAAADKLVLARMWIAEGVLHASTGDTSSADDAFAAASRLGVDAWSSDYGPAMKARYDATVGRAPVPGELELRPAPDRFVGVLDGDVVPFPAKAPAGLHLVQVGPPGGAMAFAQLLFLPPGEHTVVDHDADETVPDAPATVGPPPPVVVESPVPPPEPKEWSKTPLLVAGSAALAVGIGSGIIAATQNGAMTNAQTVPSLEAAYGRQQAFGYTGYGLMGAGGILLGLYVAL